MMKRMRGIASLMIQSIIRLLRLELPYAPQSLIKNWQLSFQA
jgi:hypothetical protein